MSAADSLYQQLRGHLAYLKLTAAAEALPAALDQAQADKLNHTEFLQRLLAIEVDASGSGVAGVQLEFGIPIGNGILTTDTDEQAMARADGQGADAAPAALELASLLDATDDS